MTTAPNWKKSLLTGGLVFLLGVGAGVSTVAGGASPEIKVVEVPGETKTVTEYRSIPEPYEVEVEVPAVPQVCKEALWEYQIALGYAENESTALAQALDALRSGDLTTAGDYGRIADDLYDKLQALNHDALMDECLTAIENN